MSSPQVIEIEWFTYPVGLISLVQYFLDSIWKREATEIEGRYYKIAAADDWKNSHWMDTQQERTPALFVIPGVQRSANHSASISVHKLAGHLSLLSCTSPAHSCHCLKAKTGDFPRWIVWFPSWNSNQLRKWSAKWSCVHTPWGQRGEKKDLLFVDGRL